MADSREGRATIGRDGRVIGSGGYPFAWRYRVEDSRGIEVGITNREAFLLASAQGTALAFWPRDA